jgi:hypothetical protein
MDQTDLGKKIEDIESHRDAGPMWGVATASPRPRLDRGRTDAVELEGQIEGGRRTDAPDQDWVAPPLNQAAAGAGWVKS